MWEDGLDEFGMRSKKWIQIVGSKDIRKGQFWVIQVSAGREQKGLNSPGSAATGPDICSTKERNSDTCSAVG
jgi:hypothetical protein